MANTVIQIKNSGTTGNTPATLNTGELAINYADGKLFYGNSSNTAVLFETSGEPAGLNQEIQFNDSGSFGASANLKYNDVSEILYTTSFNATQNIETQIAIVHTKLYAGLATAVATELPNVIAQFTSDSESYTQVNQQNINGNGSADFVITADVGTDTDFYADMGMAGSTYNFYAGYQTPFDPLTGYFLVQGSTIGQDGGNMVIGTTTPGTNVKFLVGGFENSNVVLTLEETEINVHSNLVVQGTISGPTITTMQNYTQSAFNKANTANIQYTASNTAPTSPAPKLGDKWYKIDSDILYTYSSDGGSYNFWLDISSAKITANAASASQNITGDLVVSGNVIGGNLVTTNTVTSGTLAVNSSATIGTTLGVTGNITGGNLVTTNTVTSGTLAVGTSATVGTTLGVTGNIVGGNIVTTNAVTSGTLAVGASATVGTTLGVTGNITGGNLVTTNAVTSGTLAVSSSATIGTNLGVTGIVTAGYFIGDGSQLTGIAGGGGGGSVYSSSYVLTATTTDSSEIEAYINGVAGTRIPVSTNKTIYYTADVACRRTDSTGDHAAWYIKGVATNASDTVTDIGSLYEIIVARTDANLLVNCCHHLL
jgi:hypothetical protein